MKPTRQSALDQVTLAVFVCSAVAAFASSQKTPPAWLLLLPAVVSLFWRIERVPAALRVWARYVAWAFLAGTVVLGLFLMAYPVLSEQTTTRLALLAGYGLASFSALFLLGRSVWPAASTLIPATLGTLVVASFNSAAQLNGVLALAGTAVFFYLALPGQPLSLPGRLARHSRGQFIALACSGLGTLLVAGSIILLLPWAQIKVEQALFGLFSPQSTHYSSLSLHSRLGDLEQLKLSKKVVMRVWSSRPQKLRGRVFTQFDGQTWHARVVGVTNLSTLPPDFPLSNSVKEWLDQIPGSVYAIPGHDPQHAGEAGAIRTKIVQSVFNNGMMVSPAEILLLRAPVSNPRTDAYDGLTPPLSSAIEIYGIINRRKDNLVQEGTTPPPMLEECLTLPAETDARLKELAAQLAEGTRSPEERVHRTVGFVQKECHYSLRVGKFHTSQPVAEFLFEKRQGYCEYFASATAVLLRLEGVACRYVTGFNVAEGNRQGGHYVVREADAHAWIEAYLPGQGWMEADPTPEAEYEALHADLRGGWFESATEWLTVELAETVIRIRQGDWRAMFRWLGQQLKTVLRVLFVERFGFGLLLLALVSLVIGWAAWRRKIGLGRRAPAGRREVSAPGSPELRELMFRVDNLWARQGFRRPPFRAPLEHLTCIPPDKIPPSLRQASRKVIECFYRACFGGGDVSAGEIEELQRLVEGMSAS